MPTTFRVDTCQCVVSDLQTHGFKLGCASHAILATDELRWTAVLEENQRKNIAFRIALDNGPTSLYTMIGGIRKLRDTVGFSFSWTGTAPARVLSLSFTGVSLTNTQKTTIRNALNTRFGIGKVLLP